MFELTLVKRRRRASHVTSLKRALKVIQAWRSSNAPQTWPPWNVPQTCSISAADVRQTCRKGDSTRSKSDVLQTWRASNVTCLKSSVPRIGCKRASPVLHTYLTMLQTRFKRASNVPHTWRERASIVLQCTVHTQIGPQTCVNRTSTVLQRWPKRAIKFLHRCFEVAANVLRTCLKRFTSQTCLRRDVL